MPRRTTRWRTTKTTQQHARELRREMTPAERRLWSRLRGDQLTGAHIRRQHPLGPYIVDFYHAPSRTVIEINGDVHATPEQVERDSLRTAWLVKRGYRVVRFTNEDVLRRLEGALEAIWLACSEEPSP